MACPLVTPYGPLDATRRNAFFRRIPLGSLVAVQRQLWGDVWPREGSPGVRDNPRDTARFLTVHSGIQHLAQILKGVLSSATKDGFLRSSCRQTQACCLSEKRAPQARLTAGPTCPCWEGVRARPPGPGGPFHHGTPSGTWLA